MSTNSHNDLLHFLNVEQGTSVCFPHQLLSKYISEVIVATLKVTCKDMGRPIIQCGLQYAICKRDDGKRIVCTKTKVCSYFTNPQSIKGVNDIFTFSSTLYILKYIQNTSNNVSFPAKMNNIALSDFNVLLVATGRFFYCLYGL